MLPLAEQPGVIVLKSVKDRTGVIKKNSGASLIDIGDGVACLEFHSKMNCDWRRHAADVEAVARRS